MAMHQLLPVEIATRDRVGTVKGGKNVIIDEDGTMSVDVADVGGDLAEIKRLLGMSGGGEAPDRNGVSAWSRIMYLLGLDIGEKSDAASDKGSLWARVTYLLGLNIGKQTDEASDSDSSSLWARVKYLLKCCKDIQNKPGGPTTGDLTALENRVKELEKSVKSLETRVTDLENDFKQYKKKTDGTLSDIVNKFYGGGIIGPDGIVTWGDYNKAAVGNMNVYAGDKDKSGNYKNYIMTRKDGSDNDVKVV